MIQREERMNLCSILWILCLTNSVAKARSFATICDRVTMSMAMPEMSHVAYERSV